MKEYKYKINGLKFTVQVGDIVDNEANVMVNGVPYKVELDKRAPQKAALAQSGKTNTGKELAQKMAPAAAASKPASKPAGNGAAGAIKAPLPGTVMSIDVKVGDQVSVGQKVAVLEAMKMENDIRSDKAGTVSKICVSSGDAVLEGADILILD